MGAVTYTVKTKDDMQKALADAKKTDKPVVIDVKLTHKMPFTTQHMFLDSSWQDKAKIDEFVKKYDAQDLKPFSYFLKEAQNHQLQTN
jgi:pyruvate oxidase